MDFTLRAGQALVVRGANGSGKTSLLRMLAGLLQPKSGAILWQGRDTNDDLAAYCGAMAYLGHGNGLSPELSVRENLRYTLHVAGTPRDDARIDQALADWHLEHRADHPTGLLSQGQARRLALAGVALAAKPLWLLDEPDAGLDAASLAQLESVLASHLENDGLAVVASHHVLALPANRILQYSLDQNTHA